MPKKVLVGIVTYDKMGYCLNRLVEAIKSQTFRDFDVLFVDNSDGDYNKKIESMGFRVIKDTRKDTRISNIISGRNIIRDGLLKGKYEYLFFLDSDVIIPEDAIEKLVSLKKQLATGIYLLAKHMDGKPHALPCIFRRASETGFNHFSLNEVGKDRIVEVDAAGLGCCLIHRDVLKDIKFRTWNDSKVGGEDFAFFIDAKDKGFQCYADTSVKCFHMVYPEDDPRHDFHKFETHLKIVPRSKITYSHSLNIEGFELE